MDRGDILSGDAFTAVLRSALAFVVALVLLGWLTVTYVERSLIAKLGEDVQQRWNIIAMDHTANGADKLVETIADVARRSIGTSHGVAVFDTAGNLIAGNLRTLPAGAGLKVGPLDHIAARPEDVGTDFVHFTGPVGDRTLTVAMSLELLHRTKVLVFRGIATGGFLIVVIMLTFGYYLSARSLRRLRDIEIALSRTSEGDTDVRIPESGGRTQIDRIARQMNAHLDRLSLLMATTRNTAAATAHDLKSPLGRAYLSLEKAMAQVEQGKDPTDALVDTQDALESMRVIFEAYLQLSRIDATGAAHLTSRVDLGALTREMVETFGLMAEDAGQTLRFAPDTRDYTVIGDSQMLQQLVANLLENAVTHGAPGNVITIRLIRAGDRIRFVVTDTGPGIPAEDRERVFEPFQRLDPSRSKPGSGLGLALVRAIAEKHGGRITLSDNHPGLRVEVCLPAAPSQPEADDV